MTESKKSTEELCAAWEAAGWSRFSVGAAGDALAARARSLASEVAEKDDEIADAWAAIGVRPDDGDDSPEPATLAAAVTAVMLNERRKGDDRAADAWAEASRERDEASAALLTEQTATSALRTQLSAANDLAAHLATAVDDERARAFDLSAKLSTALAEVERLRADVVTAYESRNEAQARANAADTERDAALTARAEAERHRDIYQAAMTASNETLRDTTIELMDTRTARAEAEAALVGTEEILEAAEHVCDRLMSGDTGCVEEAMHGANEFAALLKARALTSYTALGTRIIEAAEERGAARERAKWLTFASEPQQQRAALDASLATVTADLTASLATVTADLTAARAELAERNEYVTACEGTILRTAMALNVHCSSRPLELDAEDVCARHDAAIAEKRELRASLDAALAKLAEVGEAAWPLLGCSDEDSTGPGHTVSCGECPGCRVSILLTDPPSTALARRDARVRREALEGAVEQWERWVAMRTPEFAAGLSTGNVVAGMEEATRFIRALAAKEPTHG